MPKLDQQSRAAISTHNASIGARECNHGAQVSGLTLDPAVMDLSQRDFASGRLALSFHVSDALPQYLILHRLARYDSEKKTLLVRDGVCLGASETRTTACLLRGA